MSKIKRTSAALTEVLFEELEALRAGTSTPQQAQAKAKMINSAISIARLEMDHARFVAGERSDGNRLKALPMGE